MTYAPLVAFPFELRARDSVGSAWTTIGRFGTLADAATRARLRRDPYHDVRLTDEALRYVQNRTGQPVQRSGGATLRIGDGPPVSWETAEIHAEGCTPRRDATGEPGGPA